MPDLAMPVQSCVQARGTSRRQRQRRDNKLERPACYSYRGIPNHRKLLPGNQNLPRATCRWHLPLLPLALVSVPGCIERNSALA